MLEINLNPQFADFLRHHGVNVSTDEEFIHTNLPDNIKFKARTVCQEVNGSINSRLDVMVLTGKGEQIIECCSDFGATIEETINRNFQNFSTGSLHPLLAVLGCNDPHTYDQITIEEWKINDISWTAYIGNLTPKMTDNGQCGVIPPIQFFESIERGIQAQKLMNRIHWFRSYYAQWNNEIIEREFLMDNEPLNDAEQVFSTLPIIPGVKFYSCRNFIILKNMDLI